MRMLKHNLGYPQTGVHLELQKASELYWNGTIGRTDLFLVAKRMQENSWRLQKEAGIDLIPCNDFSFHHQVLDMSLMLGVVPSRYMPVVTDIPGNTEIDLYLAMVNGYEHKGVTIKGMEQARWFDTNATYVIPELDAQQTFQIFSNKIFTEFSAAKHITQQVPKPVLMGPVSYLLLGKETTGDFHRLDLLRKMMPTYLTVLKKLEEMGATWIQFDEPFLTQTLSIEAKAAFNYAYGEIKKACPGIKTLVTSFFGALNDNTALALTLPINGLHIDLIADATQLDQILPLMSSKLVLSVGIIDGRNAAITNYEAVLPSLQQAVHAIGEGRVMIAPSCSFAYLDSSLEDKLPAIIAQQKLREVHDLSCIVEGDTDSLERNKAAIFRANTVSNNHTTPMTI
ncbi:5-methyltetrahydropteroyltriglutamate--homocysteine methyltransferase [Chitinophaga skermanii]|uniref:5-methyltetrahydropteroyltriglutamate--homocysteine methyltransferase n=1 Tax=Chitinophaga skermanii TaxID=331697 RepID=A0A327QVS9_9BACT|nr:hypothetical protein [Chitinophaga skermanii]RAJ08500.1 5-methyltetrahydropteroyltriglutamate--homocysteine methyltransferase [Chitinophaga skermanii]